MFQVDQTIAALAARQHGVVARAQLLALGVGRGAIEHRLARGRLHRLHTGVYLVGHAVEPPHARLMAAVLACGPRAVLSHTSAAELWGMRSADALRPQVTVPGASPRRPGIRAHRVRHLGPEDRTTRHGIPTTRPARTLLDLEAVLDDTALARALEEALRRRLVSHAALEALLARSSGRARRRLRALRSALSAPALTRSEAERRLLELIRRARLPEPAANRRVAGHEVDLLWPAQRLVVEMDGFAFHGSRAAFERDRRRDQDLQAAGHRVLRTTVSQIDHEPTALVARVAQALVRGP